MNYTKGEWKAKIYPRHTEVWFKDVIIATCPYQTPISPEMREANAHLIAASPDMYEALKAIGDLLFGLPENDLIKQALAKAEGK